ncbi:MAG: hypothetical protein WCL07_00405 [bacterium]
MKKPIVLSIIALVALVGGIVVAKKLISPKSTVVTTKQEEVVLPVNVIPVEERPFVTLTPDASGRNLALGINNFKSTSSTVDYELVYQTSEGDEGAFGRMNLATETQPISKQLLLGSRSAGGATTFYNGVTGGAIALTWGETKVKESFNFIRFNPTDPTIISVDGRLTYTLTAKALKKDDVIVTMKTSGYPASLPTPTAKLLAGPYAILTPTTPKGVVTLSVQLPSGTHTNPTIYEFVSGKWAKLKTTLKGDTVTATPTTNIFIVTEE